MSSIHLLNMHDTYEQAQAKAKKFHEDLVINHAARLELDTWFQSRQEWEKAQYLRRIFPGIYTIYGQQVANLLGVNLYA